jgi:hypothetical protein
MLFFFRENSIFFYEGVTIVKEVLIMEKYRKYTRTSVFEIHYTCFDTEKKTHVDSYPVGYFVSMDEAVTYLKEEILNGHEIYWRNPSWVSFIDERADVPWEHSYRIIECRCGRAMPDYNIRIPKLMDL